MEDLGENNNVPKQRHGCVTAWLILMIIANSLAALSYLFTGDFIAIRFPGGISNSMLILLALLGIGNVIFSILLYKWKKIGFWGFLITGITKTTFVYDSLQRISSVHEEHVSGGLNLEYIYVQNSNRLLER